MQKLNLLISNVHISNFKELKMFFVDQGTPDIVEDVIFVALTGLILFIVSFFYFLLQSKMSQGKERVVEPANLRVVIPFSSPDLAKIAYNSLRVDREPKRSSVQKKLSVEQHCLVLELNGPDARSLRLSSNTFFDHLSLVQKTIDKFSLDKYGINKKNSDEAIHKAKKPCLNI